MGIDNSMFIKYAKILKILLLMNLVELYNQSRIKNKIPYLQFNLPFVEQGKFLAKS